MTWHAKFMDLPCQINRSGMPNSLIWNARSMDLAHQMHEFGMPDPWIWHAKSLNLACHIHGFFPQCEAHGSVCERITELRICWVRADWKRPRRTATLHLPYTSPTRHGGEERGTEPGVTKTRYIKTRRLGVVAPESGT